MAHEIATLIVLDILSEGKKSYAAVLAEYARRTGARSEQAAEQFSRRVQALIAERLIDGEADPAARERCPRIIALRLTPTGTARLLEVGR